MPAWPPRAMSCWHHHVDSENVSTKASVPNPFTYCQTPRGGWVLIVPGSLRVGHMRLGGEGSPKASIESSLSTSPQACLQLISGGVAADEKPLPRHSHRQLPPKQDMITACRLGKVGQVQRVGTAELLGGCVPFPSTTSLARAPYWPQPVQHLSPFPLCVFARWGLPLQAPPRKGRPPRTAATTAAATAPTAQAAAAAHQHAPAAAAAHQQHAPRHQLRIESHQGEDVFRANAAPFATL